MRVHEIDATLQAQTFSVRRQAYAKQNRTYAKIYLRIFQNKMNTGMYRTYDTNRRTGARELFF